jgi:hypothetical protein
MSLHHIAQHLKDQGRGPDDMLVHMTRGEVKALQGLAQAHGGSLSINPHTGLPEAGFLSSVLPMAVGALAVATGQVELLPYIAAGVGAADYAITGSLSQGLMAGLGAWSGGELVGGLEAAGAQGVVQSGANAGTTAFEAANKAALTAGTAEAGTEAALTQEQIAAQNAINSQNFPNVPQQQLNQFRADALNAADQGKFVESVGRANASLGSNIVDPTFSDRISNIGSGITNRGDTGIFDSVKNIGSFAMKNKAALLGAAAPALSNALTKQPTVPGSTAQKNPFGLKTIPRDENGKPIFNASIPEQPNPAYQAVYPDYQTNPYSPVGAASGGVMKMAVGGSAPQIGTPAQNTTMDSSVGNNTMFPMSEMARSYYATPTQMPAGINAQDNNNPATSDPSKIPGYGPRLDTNTGQMTNNFADGGLANLPYVQQSQNQPSTANGYTPAGGGSTYGQGQFSPQTMAMPTMGLDPQSPFSQMGMPSQFAQGGIAQYAGNYGSMVSALNDIQEGVETATKRRLMDTPTPDFGDMREDSDLAKLDSYNRAQTLLKKHLTASHVKPSKGLPKAAVLGAIDMIPAAQAAAEAKAKQAIAQDADTTEAKEGGLMSYAEGGESHVYKPTYTNYAQNPYQPQQAMLNPAQLEAASQAYLNQGIPNPIRTLSAPDQGYALNPSVMKSNEQLAAAKQAIIDAKNAELAAAQAAAGRPDAGPGGKSGGLMPYALHYANGGNIHSNLGGYSDGGHLLRGPGDGVSDSIPATIGGRQPARLAEGEFVIPARIVSELGNGSTDAGAKRLYAMMDRIKAKRSKTKNIAADTKAYKYLPA